MKKSFVVAMFFISTAAFANAGNETSYKAENVNTKANVNEGNAIIGGGASISYNSDYPTSVSISGSYKYFVSHGLAIGGTVNFGSYPGSSTIDGSLTMDESTTYGIGPAATYYFWEKNQLATYVGGSILYQKEYYSYRSSIGDGVVSERTAAVVNLNGGLSYFLLPSVAIGPEINLQRSFGSGFSSVVGVSLLGNLSILL